MVRLIQLFIINPTLIHLFQPILALSQLITLRVKGILAAFSPVFQHELIIDIMDQMGQFGAHNLILLTSVCEQVGLGFYGARLLNRTLLQRHAGDCHRFETLTWCEISYE